VDAPREALDGQPEEGEEEPAVVVVTIEPGVGDRPPRGVVDPVGEQRARLARHLFRN
jgi:hypothetical protein